MNQVFDAAFWDRKYEQHQGPWDPAPNDHLEADTADLTPGAALDLGCGEGADALWLAKRGWRVTGVDLSSVALARARAADGDHQVDWQQVDVSDWEPPADTYDLVSLHYVHLPVAPRPAIFARLARAIRPGGTLLVVAHHPSDQETALGRPAIPDLYFTAEEVAGYLPGRWDIVESGTRPHHVTKHGGETLVIQDMVLKARRLD